MSTPEAAKALSKAKIHLMGHPDSTFFSVVCLSLEHVWNDRIPTAATDGRQIMYNTEFFMSLSASERVSLLLHETLHVVFQHMLRLGDRKHGKWNRAADYAINLIIDKAGFPIPENWLLDDMYDGMSAEAIYDILEDDPSDDDSDDLVYTDVGTDPSLQGQIDDILVQAAQQSQMAGDKPGSIPGELERYIKDLTNPQIPWHRIMASFFSKMAKIDYSFKKPNRRFMSQKIIMPALSGEKLCTGAIAVDVSGSVSEEQFKHFISETASIIRNQQPDSIHFMQFDTDIKTNDELKNLQDLKKVDFKGWGGTKIDPVLKWAKDNKPSWLIVFTDGEFNLPDFKPDCPVIWVIHSTNREFKCPYGKIIKYVFKEK